MGSTCSSAISTSEHSQIHKSRIGSREDKNDKSVKNGGVTSPKLSSGKSQEAHISLENEESLKGDEDKDDKSVKNGGVTSPKLSSGKSQEANIAFENEESLKGDDVKPKPTRKKKSAIMFDPKMFEEIDSHVARVIQIQIYKIKIFQ